MNTSFLQAYFAKFRISDESFFQTTLCHPNAPSAFPVHSDNLRLVNWPYFDPETEWVLHPDPVQPKHVDKLMKSGALFARKFELGTSDEAWSNIEGILSKKVCVVSAVPCVLCCAACCAVLCCAVLCGAVLCCAVLCACACMCLCVFSYSASSAITRRQS